MTKVFIDGRAGTTGLRIESRLEKRDDITLVTLPDALHRDVDARHDAMAQSDVTFLCLPDAAAIEAADLASDTDTILLDASTAHRTNPQWVYGFPELSPQLRAALPGAKRVAVPGCYASGFLSLVVPLVSSGFVPKSYPFSCFAVSGYSGGGKQMIAEVEDPKHPKTLESPRFYGLANTHKHLPEMQKIAGLTHKPQFTPIVDDYYNGMVVCVPLQAEILGKPCPLTQLHALYAAHYQGAQFVHVQPLLADADMAKFKLSSNDLADTNDMEIWIFGDADQALLCSRFDNLGKGASGAAVQCMNLVLGVEETKGLL